ncbi:hypothetical protein QJS65_10350 [Bacillus altitudinis]|uniref:hypothetical protein n=1 Tax=Bacillus altitudinis TaxID=293387 RepID=UPI0024A8C422|nr:hypothetical protein [Bacillus altitudinis]WHF25251.1 hypothetical protein QJS65_10350 [Bacillus altitudinis]
MENNISIDRGKFKRFLKEISTLEIKYGIHISADYEEEIDYNWEEEPYTSGIHSFLVYTDENGNALNEDDSLFEDREDNNG